MKLTGKALRGALFMALCAGASHPAMAEEPGFYAGIKAGVYDLDIDGSDIEVSDLAWGFYGGYMFNPYIGIELEYLRLEEGDDSVRMFGESVDFALEADLWALSVKPTLPINDNWSAYAKLGWTYVDGKSSQRALGEKFSASESDDDFLAGFGLSWSNETFQARLEAQFDDDVPDFMIYSLGFGVKF